MKTLAIITAVMALALTAGEASARQSHRQQVHQYAPQTSEYESLSQGRQSYPNPDRQLYVQQGDS
jgi:hypothetical protein